MIYFSIYVSHTLRLLLDGFFTKEHTVGLVFYTHMEWIYILIAFMLFYEGLYTKRYDFWEELKNIYKALFFSAFGVLAFISIVKIGEETSRFIIFAIFLFLALLLPASRLLIKYFLHNLKIWRVPIRIITSGEQSDELKTMLQKNWYMGYSVTEKDSDTVLIATRDLKNSPQSFIQHALSNYRNLIITPFFSGIGLLSADIHYIFSLNQYFINLHNNLLLRKNLMIKNFFDILIFVLALPVFLFFLLFASLLIFFDSGGKIFFTQRRVGKNGKIFSCIKFRTMYADGDEILKDYFIQHPTEEIYYNQYRKLKYDPRVTKVGKILRKYSLDEIPQILNVLRGEMSFVGPRPYMEEEVDITDERMANIIRAKPGITGLWQVSGRNELTFEKRLEIESWYIRNWSLWVDFVIFLKTFKALLGTKKTS